MNSISEECLVLKQKYDSCFNSWFKDRFLKGYRGDSCAGVFKEYQQCVKVSTTRGTPSPTFDNRSRNITDELKDKALQFAICLADSMGDEKQNPPDTFHDNEQINDVALWLAN